MEEEGEVNDFNDYGKWERVRIIYLVYMIDDDDLKIIINIFGNKEGNYVEE